MHESNRSEQSKKILDAIQDAVILVDVDGVIRFANRSAFAMFGFSQEQLIGKPIQILVPITLQEKHIDPQIAADQYPRQTAMRLRSEVLGRRQDGSQFPTEVTLNPAGDEIVVTIRDRTSHPILQRTPGGNPLTKNDWPSFDDTPIWERLSLSRFVLDSLSAAIAIIDPNGVILAVNRTWELAALSWAKDQTRTGVGMNYLEICQTACGEGAADAAVVVRGILDVLEGRAEKFAMEYECSFEHNVRWFMLKVTPIQFDKVGAVLSHWEITDRKNVEQQLRQSEIQFRELFRNSPISTACWQFDGADFTLLDCNDAAVRLTSGSILKAVGHRLSALHAANPNHRENIRRCYEKQGTFSVEMRWNIVDWTLSRGSSRSEGLHYEPRENAGDGSSPASNVEDLYVSYSFVPPNKVIAAVQLITERKRQEAALRESEERFRAVLSALADGVIFLDQSGSIKVSNESAARIVGCSIAELNQSTAHIFDRCRLIDEQGGVLDPAEYPWVIARNSGVGMMQVSLKLVRSDDSSLRLLMNANPLWYASANPPFAVVLSLTDVTAKCMAEEQLLNHQSELAHVERLNTVGEMATILAHELNQPLSAIVNFCQGSVSRLKKGQLEGVADALEIAAVEAERAAGIIRRLREFIRKRAPHRSSVSINEVVHETLSLVRPELQLHHITLESRLAVGLPLILGDRIQLEQVLLNLIRNAIEALKEESVGDRRIVIETICSASRFVSVSVADSGKGMHSDARSRLFQPFNTTKEQGMGLGLTISRGIVEAHGGQLDFSPNQPRGSVFWFSLPGN